MLSTTVTICVAVAVFPHASVAVHVLVMVPQPCTTLFVSVKFTVIVGSQLSVAVTDGPAIIVLVHCTVSLAGTPIMTGRVVSTTVSVCEAVAVLPQRSVDVHVLVIVPQPSTTLFTSAYVTATEGEQLSLAVTAGAEGIPSHCTVVLAGTPTNCGPCVSLVKLTVCDAVALFPQESVTVHVLVTVLIQPVPSSAPSVNAAVNPVVQLSVTVAVPNAASMAAAAGLQPTVPDSVTVITGLVVS